MNPSITPAYLSFAIIISSIIGFYAWRHRELRGCRAFAILIFVSIMWMSGSILHNLDPVAPGQWLGRTLRYLGITTVPAALLVFVFQYCGTRIPRKRLILLYLIPLLSWFVLADPFHHFIPALAEIVESETFGSTVRKPYFWWVHIPYAYSLLTLCLGKVFFEIRRTSKQHRRQIVLLFVAMCFPIAADLLGLTGALGKTNLSPLSFLIFFGLMGFSIYRYQFLGSSPIAYEMVFHTIRDSVIILDADDVIQDINKAAARRLEKEPRDVIGMDLRDAFADLPDILRGYEEQKGKDDDIHTTIAVDDRFLALDITPVDERNGRVSARILTLHDVTERKQQQITLETMAFYDPLTRLANRRKFQDEVEVAIAHARVTQERFAILFLDLNRFKTVNDTMGHDVGDELLKHVGSRLASMLRQPDLLGRMGGDEFAILLHDATEVGVENVVGRMLESVQRPFKVGTFNLRAELSIGAAFYPDNGENLIQLMRHADTAMYQAKSHGGGLTFHTHVDYPEN